MSSLTNVSSNSINGQRITPLQSSSIFSIQANGTPESIFLWSKQAFRSSSCQQRAFQVLAAKFVLHYLPLSVVTNNDGDFPHDGDAELLRCKRLLINMVGNASSSNNLIMFLASPSGVPLA